MRTFGISLFLGALALLAGIAGAPSARAAQDETLRAFSSWEGHGQLLQTGPKEATFTGMIAGRFMIDTDQGPVDAGTLTCPFVLHVKLDDNTQKGSGACVLAGPGGDRIYLDLTCAGVPLVGCTGESTITGGSGPYLHATGGGHFVVRSSTREFVSKPDATLTSNATGIIFWPALHYKTP
jgi:hypothetical protein